jgi:hypothetical protein
MPNCTHAIRCFLFYEARLIVFFYHLRVDTEIVDIGPPADWVKINVWESVSICCFLFSKFLLSWALVVKFSLLGLVTNILHLYTERLLWDVCFSPRTSAWRGKHLLVVSLLLPSHVFVFPALILTSLISFRWKLLIECTMPWMRALSFPELKMFLRNISILGYTTLPRRYMKSLFFGGSGPSTIRSCRASGYNRSTRAARQSLGYNTV